MELFNIDTFKEALNPAKFIDQAEKNTQAILCYIEPKELSNTLVALTSDATDFLRAQLAAFESITAIAKTSVNEFTKNLEKSVKSK
jgi:hypothetical protein